MTERSIQVFDAEQAKLRMGGLEILEKMGRYFVTYVPTLVEPMQNAFTGREWERLRQANHKLLGSVGNFGENKAYYASLNLEETLDRKDFDEAPAQYQKVIKEVDELKRALTSFVS